MANSSRPAGSEPRTKAVANSVASAIRTTPGTPATRALVRSSQACGTWSALICLPPAHRLLMPRKTASVPSVTTMAGTRPTVTTSPLAMPQARPMALERASARKMFISGWACSVLAAA